MKRSVQLAAAAAFALAATLATEAANAGLVEVKDGYVIETGNKYEIVGVRSGYCDYDMYFDAKPDFRRVAPFATLGNVVPISKYTPKLAYKCNPDPTIRFANCPAGSKWFYVTRVGGYFAVYCLGGEPIAYVQGGG